MITGLAVALGIVLGLVAGFCGGVYLLDRMMGDIVARR